ncbi:hypothetical protein Tco_0714832 [Tanacetum coccineum]
MNLKTEAHIEQILPSPTTYQRKRNTQKHRRTKKDTKLPQTSVPQDLGADKVVHKEGDDSVESAITTVASLDASDNIIRTQTTAMPNADIPQGMDTGGRPRRQETIGGPPTQTRQRKSSISQPRRRKYRQFESLDDDLDEEDTSKQGRNSDKTKLNSDKIKSMFKDSDFDVLDAKQITTTPSTPPTTAIVFDEKDVTMDESTGLEIAEMEIA